MASFFSNSTATVKPKTRRRSQSEVRTRDKDVRKRVPIFEVERGSDVCTAICKEIGSSLLAVPNINTGVLFKTIRESNMAINQSDIIILVTAAVMGHLGNHKILIELLKKSGTVTSYYNKMGLGDDVVRSLFVTMIMAMNPLFATMVESTIKISLDRLSRTLPEAGEDERYNRAVSSLVSSGSVRPGEVRVLMPNVKTIRIPDEYSTVVSSVRPSDSISMIGSNLESGSVVRRVTKERDLMDFIKRRRSSNAPIFDSEFPEETKPVRANAVRHKRGLGHESPPEDDDVATVIQAIKDISLQKATDRRRPTAPLSPRAVPAIPKSHSSVQNTPTAISFASRSIHYGNPGPASETLFSQVVDSENDELMRNIRDNKRGAIGMGNRNAYISLEDVMSTVN